MSIRNLRLEEVNRIVQPLDAAFCEAAILADKLGDGAFGNAVVDHLLKIAELCGVIPSVSSTSTLHAALPHTSPVHQLLLDFWQSVDSESLEKSVHSLPAASTCTLSVRLHK